MNILTNWENFTDEELERIKESLESEVQKRKEKTTIIINNFLNAFHELEKAGINVFIYGEHGIPIYKHEFYFESKKGV